MDESIAHFPTWSQIIKKPLTPIAPTQLDEDDGQNNVDEDDGQNNVHWKKLLTQEWIEKYPISNPAVADNATDERDNQAVADIPIVQEHSFDDNSTGISFYNHISAYDDAELEDHTEDHKTIKMSQMVRNIIGRLYTPDDVVLATEPTQTTRDTSIIDLPHRMSSKPTIPAEVDPNSVPLESCEIPMPYKAVQNDNNATDFNHDQKKNDQVVSVDPAPNDEAELEFDDEGRVFDDHGCVFFNADEIEYVWYVYVENNGLEYLKSETFQAATADVRKRTEREFKAMYKLINRKFDGDASDSNELITYTARGTAKRRCSNSSVGIIKRPSIDRSIGGPSIDRSIGGSICSNGINSLASSEHQSEKQASLCESSVADCCSTDDNEKCSNVGCKMMPYNDLMEFMAEFAMKMKDCEHHHTNALGLMEE